VTDWFPNNELSFCLWASSVCLCIATYLSVCVLIKYVAKSVILNLNIPQLNLVTCLDF